MGWGSGESVLQRDIWQQNVVQHLRLPRGRCPQREIFKWFINTERILHFVCEWKVFRKIIEVPFFFYCSMEAHCVERSGCASAICFICHMNIAYCIINVKYVFCVRSTEGKRYCPSRVLVDRLFLWFVESKVLYFTSDWVLHCRPS